MACPMSGSYISESGATPTDKLKGSSMASYDHAADLPGATPNDSVKA